MSVFSARMNSACVAGEGFSVIGNSLFAGMSIIENQYLRRVVLGRGALVRCDHRLEVQRLARHARDLGRVHEAVAADEHLILRRRQIRHDVPALVVGHDGADEPRRQIASFPR